MTELELESGVRSPESAALTDSPTDDSAPSNSNDGVRRAPESTPDRLRQALRAPSPPPPRSSESEMESDLFDPLLGSQQQEEEDEADEEEEEEEGAAVERGNAGALRGARGQNSFGLRWQDKFRDGNLAGCGGPGALGGAGEDDYIKRGCQAVYKWGSKRTGKAGGRCYSS
ncbi:hypothetical protein V8C86DRAFT_3090499 [Haematococcus lacustris]